MTIRYVKGAEKPALRLWLEDDDGTLIDLSTGYTFTVKVGVPGSAATLTKTSSITGAAGAGSEPDGTPNLTVTWTAGELNISPGAYTLQIDALTGTLNRIWQYPLEIVDVIT